MGRNVKPIFAKIQNVMGIKNGKYCSSDVSVVSLNNNGGNPQSHTLGNKPEAPTNTIGLPSVTYTNCPNGERKTINFNEIQMNNNIIPDCVLGGSVTLNDLSGYVVNYGDTICTTPTPTPTPTNTLIQSCNDGKTYSVEGLGGSLGGIVYKLTFKGGMLPNGCYTIVGTTTNAFEDTVSTSTYYGDCNYCLNPTPSPSYSSPTPTPTITPTPTPLFTYRVGSYSEIEACNKPSGSTEVYSSSSFIEVNTTFLYTNQELTIPYYSFGLVHYNTKSGTFTLGTGFDGKVSDLNPCT